MEILFALLILFFAFKLTFVVTSIFFKIFFSLIGIILAFLILPLSLIFLAPFIIGVLILGFFLKLIF